MGFTEALTLAFIVLKLTHEISWPWWEVLLPEIVAVCGYIFVFCLVLVDVSAGGYVGRRKP